MRTRWLLAVLLLTPGCGWMLDVDHWSGADDGSVKAREVGPPPDAWRPPPDARRATDAARPDAGRPDAGPVLPADVGPLDDTDPLLAQGRFGPAARVTWAQVPVTAEAAVAGGCDVVGTRKGSGLSRLVRLAGGTLEEQVTPDADGEIGLILLGRLAGWQAGQTGNAAGAVDFELYLGQQDAVGGLWIDPRSFVDEDPAGPPRNRFPGARIDDARIRVPPAEFTLTLEPDGEVPLSLRFSATRIHGELSVDALGFSIDAGTLVGYLTRAALLDLIGQLQAACRVQPPPSLCNAVEILAPLDGTPEDALARVLPLVGGFDAHLDGDTARTCESDCDATSVCIRVEMRGATVLGVR